MAFFFSLSKECLLIYMLVMLIVAELFAYVWLLKAKEDIMLNMLMEFSLYGYSYITMTSQPSVGSSILPDTESNDCTNVI
jgi:hypothetical protein